VDLGTEATAASSQRLLLLSAFAFQGTSSTRMCTDDGTVNEQVFHIWVIHEMLMHLFPDFVVAPARESLVDAVPVAVRIWQQSPLSTAPGDPQHAFDETTTVGFFANIDMSTGAQKLEYL
jgi:hypothetical protein